MTQRCRECGCQDMPVPPWPIPDLCPPCRSRLAREARVALLLRAEEIQLRRGLSANFHRHNGKWSVSPYHVGFNNITAYEKAGGVMYHDTPAQALVSADDFLNRQEKT